MGTNAFKQIVRTIQNKIPVSKGLIRRSRETEQGYLADIHNFELEDGTLKFRQGTRLMANMVDELWYDIQSFKFGNTELVMGINYKRELWGWLAKWPETSFKIWNTSPFRRTYPHRTDGGASNPSGHFSFERGNKFYMLEDNFSVILVNDYAEIFRIMKNGCFRITADKDYADQREAIQDARDDDSLVEGRIYLDIKEATNKVFNERMYIGDEYIRRSHRITGETRFAWVNELNVVSELSDPIDIEGYRHVVVSKYDPADYNPIKKSIPIKRVVLPNSIASLNATIYNHTSSGIDVGATSGNTWLVAQPEDGMHTLGGVVLAVKSGTWTDASTGVVSEIPEGVYLSLYKAGATGLDPTIPVGLRIDEYNFNFVELPLLDVMGMVLLPGTTNYGYAGGSGEKVIQRLFSPLRMDVGIGCPVIYKASTGDYGIMGHFFPKHKTQNSVYFDNTELESDGAGFGTWIKLSNTYVENVYHPNVVTIDTTDGLYEIIGRIFEVNIPVVSKASFDDAHIYWDKSLLRGIEADQKILTSDWSFWQNTGYDTWQYKGRTESISIASFDLDNKEIIIDGIDDDVDIILKATNIECFSALNSRFALWNNSHIQGISQRFFHDNDSVVYEGVLQNSENNNSISDPEETLSVGYAPLMTLDYTGLRRIPMPLPMIRRAMRNPQHLTTAGGKVYSVEDNKIWVGSVDDFMMVDYIEIHSAVDHIASMDTGIVASTRQGLFYVASGEGIKRVIGGEMIMSKFLAPCSGGVLSVDGRDIHIVYKQVTDSGAWYPTVAKINNALTEINLEGEIKSVSIDDMIYIADDWNVWIYDMANKVWAGKRHYKNRIHRLFAYKNKLGVAFETGVDRRNSFNNESWIDR